LINRLFTFVRSDQFGFDFISSPANGAYLFETHLFRPSHVFILDSTFAPPQKNGSESTIQPAECLLAAALLAFFLCQNALQLLSQLIATQVPFRVPL
jgi:hypothetical protein